jgi:hypothetical protein
MTSKRLGKALNIWKSKIIFVCFTTMASFTLLHRVEMFKIPTLSLINKCRLVQNSPTLLVSPYRVQSLVSLSIFREFISALEGNAITITGTHFTDIHRLYEEFCFSELAAELSEFHSSMDFKEGEAKAKAESEDELQYLNKRQSNTITTLRCCGSKSLSSPQILGVL